MERLQGPINSSCFYSDHLDFESLELRFANIESWRFDEEEQFSSPSLEDKMPFLQMLQSVESSPPLFPLKEPSFQTMLRLQHLKKPWEITQDLVEFHSQVKSETREPQIPHSGSGNREQKVITENCFRVANPGSKNTQLAKSAPVTRERRKRKRTRSTKNKEEVESQRMTHIAVERNRRRQMNDHLNVLRSLMPTSYIQRGDQASIIGGAIDFVKELEQLLHSLEAQKRSRNVDSSNGGENSVTSSSSSAMAMASSGIFMSVSHHSAGSEEGSCSERRRGEGVSAENRSEAADIEVTVIQTHVNLKIQCPKRPGQLLKAIVALENLRLTILHLNITTSQATVLYSFNLKIEDDCKLLAADDIAAAVGQIFSFINRT